MVNNRERRAPKKIPPTLEGPPFFFSQCFFPTSSNLVLCFLAINRYKCPFSWLNHHLIFTKLRCLRLWRLHLHRDLRKIPGLPMDSATCHHDSPFMVVEWYNPPWYNSPPPPPPPPRLLLLLLLLLLWLWWWYNLVVTVWWFQPTPLKNDGLKVSWDDDIPFPINMESHNIPCFQSPPTR